MRPMFLSCAGVFLSLSSYAQTNPEPHLFSYQRRKIEAVNRVKIEILKEQKSNAKTAILDRDIDENVLLSTSGDRYFGNVFIASVHGDVTAAALKDRLSFECLNFLIDENIKQDRGDNFKLKENHFDNNTICESHKLVDERIGMIKGKANRRDQLHLLGAVFHAIQDFYSHSNYLEASLEKDDKKSVTDIPLFDFPSFCNVSNGTYKDLGVVFTGSYEGNHGVFDRQLTEEDLANPRSHLHWNKDFSPKHNRGLAEKYSRSSLKRSKAGKGEQYFDFVTSLQIRETQRIFEQVAVLVKGLDSKCKL